MLFALSSLRGSPVDALDGRAGTVKDFLFDDRTWRVRWLVVDTGNWLPGRKVLVHSSAIGPLDLGPPSGPGLPMMSMREGLALSVRLNQRQIEASPDISEDEPVSEQLQSRIYDHYGWDPQWGFGQPGSNAIASALSAPSYLAADATTEVIERPPAHADGDPHLHSVAAVVGCHLHATDGDIGHLENFLADDGSWGIRYLMVATSNWWVGSHVLLAPAAVQEIDWPERHMRLNVSREQVKSSPPWDPVAAVDRMTEEQFHSHYTWPGEGW